MTDTSPKPPFQVEDRMRMLEGEVTDFERAVRVFDAQRSSPILQLGRQVRELIVRWMAPRWRRAG
jgi:hypothetical protein